MEKIESVWNFPWFWEILRSVYGYSNPNPIEWLEQNELAQGSFSMEVNEGSFYIEFPEISSFL